ncbi:autotransporter domain-containing protein (plasmid) [Nitrobacter sp. NHB1]|uniref:autotransporter outer membrane beta-barrel domain-containing protein n=1 Tax=Nitrobacter sp. NHB1 TaxID=3119830 RepID=UPI0030009958
MSRLSIYKAGLAAWLALALTRAAPAAAQDASWLAAPPGSDFNDAANWTPTTVPTGTASFGTSTGTTITFANDTALGGWTFNTSASNYSFTNDHFLIFTGGGIVVSGGNVSISNNNLLQFSHGSTAGSANITDTNNGVLQFIDTSTAGNANIANNGSVVFYDATGAGSANITNKSSLYFFGGSTADNASITNNSSLQFATLGTAGSASVTNNSILEFYDSSTAGSASIINNGTLQFYNTSTAGNASITNGAAIARIDFSESSGPLNNGQLSAGSIAGNGEFYLGANQLTVGGNNLSTIVSGIISDCGPSGLSCGLAGAFGGSLVKVGTGTLTLAGANIYTGATTVDAGTLNVTGSLAASSPVSVSTGAVLAGTGSVGSVGINSGGTLAPGDGTPGSSMSLGRLALHAGAMYVVMLNPATASSANVTGAATLSDATVSAVYANGSYISKQYTILTAGNVSGTFGSLANTNLPANFTTSLSYDPTHAYLNLTLNFIPQPARAFTSPNQRNVANALTNSFNTAGGIPLVFGTLTPAGLTQVSGEVAIGSQQATFNAMNLFLGILSDPFVAGRGNGATENGAAPAYAAIYRKAPAMAYPLNPRWSVWAAGYGGSQSTDGNASLGSSTTTSSVAGVAVGADYLISLSTTAGFAMAGGGTNFNVANGRGSGHSDLFQAGAFIRHNTGAAYLSGALAYGWQDITTNRIVTIAGSDRLQARFSANAWSGRAEGGYRVVSPAMGGVGITPYAAGQFTTFDLPAYAESILSGANTFAQAYNAKSVTDPRSELGVRTDKSYAVQDAILTLRGRLAWAHDFNPDRTVAVTFQTLPGASFVVNGTAMASDAALVTGAAEMKWINNWSMAATFEGELSNVTQSYAGKGIVRYAW